MSVLVTKLQTKAKRLLAQKKNKLHEGKHWPGLYSQYLA